MVSAGELTLPARPAWTPPPRYRDFVDFVETYLWVRTKAGDYVPFMLNGSQRRYLDEKAAALDKGIDDFNALKSRRCGISTIEQAESYYVTTQNVGQHCITLAHKAKSTEQIFDIAVTFYREAMTGSIAKPHIDPSEVRNRKALRFHHGRSRFTIGTAAADSEGRGNTYQRVHMSEVAFYKLKRDSLDDLMAGLEEAATHGQKVRESSPRGASGYFFEKWQQGKDPEARIANIFLPWPIDPGNRVACESDAERLAIMRDLDSEEASLVKKYGLVAEQVKWRRRKKAKLKKRFKQEYPEDDISCFLTGGVCFFDLEVIQDLLVAAEAERLMLQPFRKWRGRLTVYRRPIKGRRYVIGADSAEGNAAGDWTYAKVIDAMTGQDCARIRGKIRPHEFGKMLDKLGRWYNGAMQVVEANNHGHSTLNTLVNACRYPTSRIYHHVAVGQDKRVRSKKLGFETNSKTRSDLLDTLAEGLEEDTYQPIDEIFLGECRTFNKQENEKYEADEGAFDDGVIATALAWYGVIHMRRYRPTKKDRLKKEREAALELAREQEIAA